MARDLSELLAEAVPQDGGGPDLETIEARVSRRRRWAGAGVAMIVVALAASLPQLLPDAPETPVIGGVPVSESSACSAPGQGGQRLGGVDVDGDGAPDVTSGLSPDPPEGGVVTVRTVDGTEVQIPAFELAADGNGLHLLERGTDRQYVERRTLLSSDDLWDLIGPGRIERLWVRPGSTVDDLQALVSFNMPETAPRMATLHVTGGGASIRATMWEDDARLSSWERVWTGPEGAWSPDGTSFVHWMSYDGSRPDEITVVDVDDDGHPRVVGRIPYGTAETLQWVDDTDDGFGLLVMGEPAREGQWDRVRHGSGGPPVGDAEIVRLVPDSFAGLKWLVTEWRRGEDGCVEWTGISDAHDQVLVAPVYAVRTEHGILEGIAGGTIVRLLPDSGGEALATVEVPTDLDDWRFAHPRLSIVGGERVVLVEHDRGLAVLAPTADGTLDVAVLPVPVPRPDAFDWVD